MRLEDPPLGGKPTGPALCPPIFHQHILPCSWYWICSSGARHATAARHAIPAHREFLQGARKDGEVSVGEGCGGEVKGSPGGGNSPCTGPGVGTKLCFQGTKGGQGAWSRGGG